MATKALGLIETVGLSAALEAADAMVKAARVELVGYELTRGGGMVLIKVRGDVGAVKAAVNAGAAAAALIGRVVSTHIIPRPNSGMEPLISSVDKMGTDPKNNKPASTVGNQIVLLTGGAAAPGIALAEVEKAVPETRTSEVNPEPEVPIIIESEDQQEQKIEAEPLIEGEPVPERPGGEDQYCNLCGDPKCPRRKRDPHALCLHYSSGKS